MLCLFWLAFPAKLHCLKISLLGKTLGSSISFYSLCLFFPPPPSRPRRRNILNRLEGGKERPTPIQRAVKVMLTLGKHRHHIDIDAVPLTYVKCVSYFWCREDIHTWAQDQRLLRCECSVSFFHPKTSRVSVLQLSPSAVPGWKWFQSSQRPPIGSPLPTKLALGSRLHCE